MRASYASEINVRICGGKLGLCSRMSAHGVDVCAVCVCRRRLPVDFTIVVNCLCVSSREIYDVEHVLYTVQCIHTHTNQTLNAL